MTEKFTHCTFRFNKEKEVTNLPEDRFPSQKSLDIIMAYASLINSESLKHSKMHICFN